MIPFILSNCWLVSNQIFYICDTFLKKCFIIIGLQGFSISPNLMQISEQKTMHGCAVSLFCTAKVVLWNRAGHQSPLMELGEACKFGLHFLKLAVLARILFFGFYIVNRFFSFCYIIYSHRTK